MIIENLKGIKSVVHQRGFEPPRREARAPQARVSTVPPLVHFDNLKGLSKPVYED